MNFTYIKQCAARWLSLSLLIISLPTNLLATKSPKLFQAADALSFFGKDSYVTFGQANKLGLANFTLETWFRRDGLGQASFTGNGGLSAIPLITKGRGEDDGSRVDMNYFLGIDNARGVLAADFEDKVTGGNHPVSGITQLRYNTWYHAALTYNGSKLRLYLNGILEAEIAANIAARNDSLQHAALASALNSTGVPEGYFEGALDEVRIWNYALPAGQIQDGMRKQIPATATANAFGLVACWGLNEGFGTQIVNLVSQGPNGTMRGVNWAWGLGVGFDTNRAPTAPTLVAPANNGSGISTAADLSVSVGDLDNNNLTVTWYGKAAAAQGSDFTLAVLPDTQYYTGALNGGTPAIFTKQTQWIVNNQSSKNIIYTAHLGDCVENGNSSTLEWDRAVSSLKLLENPLTGFADGIPFGLAVGNHDQTPNGNAAGASTQLYNQYFGTSRFRARQYYGGRYGTNHDNHYQLFSASGLDFIVIYLEYDPTPSAAVINWADALLKTYSNRRAIVVSHNLLTEQAAFSAQGQAVYNALKNNSNLFLMLAGHVLAEARRQDIFNGRTVHTLLSDYQGRDNGGNGWMRYLEFSPANNQIRVKTYSPVLNTFETDADSQFTLAYDMQSSGFAPLKTNPNIAAGTVATMRWTGLQANTDYEWYVTVSDGFTTVTSPRWKFRTGIN